MGKKSMTGWEPERRTHFDEIVEGYNAVRPEYPSEMLADVLRYAGRAKGKKAIEIGAGTGKATEPFLRVGYDVTAVEIGENMADFLRNRFREYANFDVVVSSFEDAALKEGEYDLIYAASAFHWVDARVGCPKMHGLLAPGGACALLRYNFSIHPAEGEALCDVFRALYEEYYYVHYTSKCRPVKMTHDLLKTPERIKSGYGFRDLREYGFEDIVMKLYDAALTYDADRYIAHLDTLSDHRALPEQNRSALYAGIRDAIREHSNSHQVNCIFQLYMGRKA